jgi:hypothetical protein
MRSDSPIARRALLPAALLFLVGGTMSSALPSSARLATTASARLSVTPPRSDYRVLRPLGGVDAASVSDTASASAGAPSVPVLTADPAAAARAREHPASPAGASPETPSIRAGTLNAASGSGPLLTGFAGASHDGDIEQWCSAGGSCTDQDQNVTPPDDDVAVSSTQVAEIVNGSLWVYNRSGVLQFAQNLSSVFPGCVNAPASEPQIEYDSLANRWYLAATEWDQATSPASSCVVVMVSQGGSISSAGLSSWYPYGAGYVPDRGLIYDSPKLGFSSDKLVVSWNDFPCDDCSAVGEETWVIQKSQLLSGDLAPDAVVLFGEDGSRFGIVPVQSLSSTSDEWAVYNNSDPYLQRNTNSPTLGMIDISGTPLAGNLRYTEYDPTITPTSIPPYVAQPGTSLLLNTDDDRLLDAVWMDGLLWTAANDACGTTPEDACARYIEAQAIPGSVQIMTGQDWDVGGNGTNAYYPSVTFDASGDMVGSVNVSTTTTYASVDVVGQPVGYALGPAFVDPAHQGTLAYEVPGAPVEDDYGGDRWGDYGGAAYDPADPHGAWVVGEFTAPDVIAAPAGVNDNWATWIQDVEASGPLSGVATPGGGYTLDGFGGVHPFGDSPPVTATGYWPGWTIARSIQMNPCDTSGQISGWVMDGFGGLHPFAASGTPMPAVPYTTGYWPGWTIANDFVAFCITVGGVQHAAGCVLDGFGGLHAWADSSAVIADVPCSGTGYWPGWDIATKIAVIPGTDEGYVMDGFGGLHPFNGAPPVSPSGYWPGWEIAAGVVATANGGYTVDGFGGTHPFGSAPPIAPSGYTPGSDVARGIAMASGGTGAYTLDAFGMVHPAGGSPSLSVSGYWPGWSIVCDFVTAP